MKIGRSIGIGVSVLALIIVAAVILLLSSLDSIVAGAIEKYGSQVTRTPVKVSSVNIELKSGAGTISHLSVGNPAGFTAPHIFTLGGISTRINIDSVREDPVVIEEVTISAPAVFYEINKDGASNLKELQKNIAQSTGGGESAAESADSGGPGLVIRKLVIEGGEIDAKVAALAGKELSAKLPRIQLNNIGEKEGGASAAEVATQVINAIIAKTGPAVANLGLDKYVGKNLDEAKALLNEKAEGKLGEKLKGGTKGIKSLLGD